MITPKTRHCSSTETYKYIFEILKVFVTNCHNYLTMSTYDKQDECASPHMACFRFYIPEFGDTHISYARTAKYAKVDKIDCDILFYEMRFS
jgi:hypothetical protein